jgi:hypothetical protein
MAHAGDQARAIELADDGPATPQPVERLGSAERAALEQLGAVDGYATRWAVGRRVARSLAARQLVVVASDYVLLTEAGRRALSAGGDAPGPPGPAGEP